jgi:hypothetical protein
MNLLTRMGYVAVRFDFRVMAVLRTWLDAFFPVRAG